MLIRTASIEDLPDIVCIYNQAIKAGRKTGDTEIFSVDERKNWFETHKSHNYPILVAEEENKVIGYLSLSPYRPGRNAFRHTAEVSYYVHFNHHRKGVAASLLQHALDLCRDIGLETLIAILLAGNEGSIRLLEKFNFEKWGHLPSVADFDGLKEDHYYYGLRV